MPLDANQPHEAELLDKYMRFASSIEGPPHFYALEARDSILARTEGAAVISDDNVASEWKARFEFPITANE